MHLCADKFVVFQVDANNLLGIVNRGSPRLKLNALVRELFWLGLEHRITLTVEWVPGEKKHPGGRALKDAHPGGLQPQQDDFLAAGGSMGMSLGGFVRVQCE
jgi:hypothetical protein